MSISNKIIKKPEDYEDCFVTKDEIIELEEKLAELKENIDKKKFKKTNFIDKIVRKTIAPRKFIYIEFTKEDKEIEFYYFPKTLNNEEAMEIIEDIIDKYSNIKSTVIIKTYKPISEDQIDFIDDFDCGGRLHFKNDFDIDTKNITTFKEKNSIESVQKKWNSLVDMKEDLKEEFFKILDKDFFKRKEWEDAEDHLLFSHDIEDEEENKEKEENGKREREENDDSEEDDDEEEEDEEEEENCKKVKKSGKFNGNN
jgi:hypothetical protein